VASPADPPSIPEFPKPPWQALLDFDQQDAGHYLDFVNTGVLQMIDGTPRNVIDLGCAGGSLGAALKQRFPAAHVVGVEAGSGAAKKAAERLDRVVHARLEDFDPGREGFAPRAFDTVIAADVLEHLVNPWQLLVTLRPYLTPNAQVIASIPNVRNLWLVARLLTEGRWEYTERGLLDVTHVRFFTLDDMRRMFEETGYRAEGYGSVILPSLREAYAAYQGKGAKTLKFGRLSLENVSPEELTQLCAEGFILRCRAP
jgi:2-polyprenyl-3-methyl-5-hydroxy-6-metoxy-1,4-benzoquinol methylase